MQGTAGKHRNLAFIKALSGEAFSPGPIEWPTDGAAAGEASPGLAEPWLVQALSGKEPGGVKAGASATRPRLLFQYKPYSQQGALNLSQTEVAAVLEAVFGKPVDPRSGTPTPSPLPRGTPGAGTEHNTALSAAGDVGAVVLIKLIMDLYLRVGAQAAFALVLYMFQAPLVHGPPAARCRVFDVLANLAVHAEMLRAAPADNVPEDTEAVAQAGENDNK